MAKRSLEIKREYERQEEYETEDEVGESENDDETVDYGGGGDGVEEEEEEEEQEEREEEVEDRRKRALIRIVSGQRRGVPSNTLCCQADDCGVDLRAAKRYHRRHKVCERHAKAAFVFLGGIEQRFCQQCSSLMIPKEAVESGWLDITSAEERTNRTLLTQRIDGNHRILK
ncbi:squamosa promoter-binding protein 2 isoform X2 [Vitis vinifera]|uniref:squamosa promoter-binding protein 2 isoform X2 n=1 Tax=Vitis vinifera TaxID=29760 RepID=UPI0001985EA9|nr:squamosa promoter-binding protein 2 isoform X2 [Vitis vinifera]|eukprot:XP_019075138.1 PREDICTED: squamosa promoter-binding protein 2 isoform X2 [Vitis vinifera]